MVTVVTVTVAVVTTVAGTVLQIPVPVAVVLTDHLVVVLVSVVTVVTVLSFCSCRKTTAALPVLAHCPLLQSPAQVRAQSGAPEQAH